MQYVFRLLSRYILIATWIIWIVRLRGVMLHDRILRVSWSLKVEWDVSLSRLTGLHVCRIVIGSLSSSLYVIFSGIYMIYIDICIYTKKSIYITCSSYAVYSCISLDYIYSHKLILLYPPVILAINFRRRAENKKSGCDAQIGTFAPSHRTIGFDWCTTFWRLGWKGYPKKWWGKWWVNSKRWVEFLSPPIFCWGEIFRYPAVWVYKISSKRARVAPRSVGSLGSDWAALGSFDESFAYHI